MRVAFFLPHEPDLDRLSRLDPDRDWREFARGERAWILQTYLRLKAAGEPVELLGRPRAVDLLVYHAKHGREVARGWRVLGDTVLVGVRADNREPTTADFQILQNRVFADEASRFFVPFWPQPGLLPRAAARAARIERVAFKGFAANLHPEFLGASWSGFLAARGLTWVFDAVKFRGFSEARSDLVWRDYGDVDLVVAVRPEASDLHAAKPANKLINAWLAEVPALLGPERAYRDLRRSPLDYLEVASVGEACAAVDRLLADPTLYNAMVENGRLRGAEFTAAAIVPRWRELLFERIPALAGERPLRSLPFLLRPPLRRLARWFAGRPAR